MTSGVSRPPGARLTTARKAPQGPPEIYRDTAFPSLQSTARHVESRKYRDFVRADYLRFAALVGFMWITTSG